MQKTMKKDMDRDSEELVIKWKLLLGYLENNQKDPDIVLETFMKLEDVVHIWSKKDIEPSMDRTDIVELQYFYKLLGGSSNDSIL
ncbi:hypothetical protein M3226_02675 [Neobacillus cucumis]|uniref:hypothetical protein n=1 Tax=Neobacillus cucumis TaxID=1740721 RepID=UPI0020405A63|nr:hypothetical protein [Neobacillus cucumis]MCM3724606.1 hypothetical protein [Neobacillus cucumis]